MTGEEVRIVALDASAWASAEDFYEAMLGGLGAPEWHGRNLGALEESMIYGVINAVDPPLRVEIANLYAAGDEALTALYEAFNSLTLAGAKTRIGKDGVALIQVDKSGCDEQPLSGQD